MDELRNQSWHCFSRPTRPSSQEANGWILTSSLYNEDSSSRIWNIKVIHEQLDLPFKYMIMSWIGLIGQANAVCVNSNYQVLMRQFNGKRLPKLRLCQSLEGWWEFTSKEDCEERLEIVRKGIQTIDISGNWICGSTLDMDVRPRWVWNVSTKYSWAFSAL